MHDEELHNFYSSPDIILMIKSRMIRWAGHVARMGKIKNAYKVLVRKPEGGKPLERPSHRWEDNIKIHLEGFGGVDWIHLAQNTDR
jgi:hypothetical protein